jgi:hypothetical protein
MNIVLQTLRSMFPVMIKGNKLSPSIDLGPVQGSTPYYALTRPTTGMKAANPKILDKRPRVDAAGVPIRYKIEECPKTLEECEAIVPDLIAEAVEEGRAGKISSYTKESLERIRGYLTVSLDGKIVKFPANLAQLEALAPEVVELARAKGRGNIVKPAVTILSEKVPPSTPFKPSLAVAKEAHVIAPLSLEERCKIEWNKSPQLQKRFSWSSDPFKSYVNIEKALARNGNRAYTKEVFGDD